MNFVKLQGRVQHNPEEMYTKNGNLMCKFTLAVERKRLEDGRQYFDYINCVAWREVAEEIKHNMKEGQYVELNGHINVSAYVNQSAKKRWVTQVVADKIIYQVKVQDELGRDVYRNKDEAPF